MAVDRGGDPTRLVCEFLDFVVEGLKSHGALLLIGFSIISDFSHRCKNYLLISSDRMNCPKAGIHLSVLVDGQVTACLCLPNCTDQLREARRVDIADRFQLEVIGGDCHQMES